MRTQETTDEVEQLVRVAVEKAPEGVRFAQLVTRMPDRVRPHELFGALSRLAAHGVIRATSAGTVERPTAVKYYARETV